jgi:hypothetical protein
MGMNKDSKVSAFRVCTFTTTRVMKGQAVQGTNFLLKAIRNEAFEFHNGEYAFKSSPGAAQSLLHRPGLLAECMSACIPHTVSHSRHHIVSHLATAAKSTLVTMTLRLKVLRWMSQPWYACCCQLSSLRRENIVTHRKTVHLP